MPRSSTHIWPRRVSLQPRRRAVEHEAGVQIDSCLGLRIRWSLRTPEPYLEIFFPLGDCLAGDFAFFLQDPDDASQLRLVQRIFFAQFVIGGSSDEIVEETCDVLSFFYRRPGHERLLSV